MKIRVILLVVLVLLFGLPSNASLSTGKKKVEILDVDHVYVESWRRKDMELTANLIFHNHYRIKLKLKYAQIDIFVDDERLGTIIKEGKMKLPKRSTSDIPLEAHVVPGKTLGRLMANSGKMLVGKKVTIQFEGRVRLRALFLPLSIKLDESAELGLSDIKFFKSKEAVD